MKKACFIGTIIFMAALWLGCEVVCFHAFVGYGEGTEGRIARLYFCCIALGLVALGMTAKDQSQYLKRLKGACIMAAGWIICYTALAVLEISYSGVGEVLFLLLFMGMALFGNPLLLLVMDGMELLGINDAGHWWVAGTCVFYVLFFFCGWIGTKVLRNDGDLYI